MEVSIMKLDSNTDETTREMLQKLVEKKRKFDMLKTRHLFVMWLTIIVGFFYAYWLYKHIAVPFSHSFAIMFSIFIAKTFNLYALCLIVGSFGFMNVLKQKKDKAEKEYNELRCEIIDKAKDLWKKEEEWKSRHHVFYMMKKEYDINLFHETK
ncbi:YpbF family protein [Niallia taxi]|uniref:YpbF family protein n=1 Tax=Niallia taxi TaxID=2499688 RepID=UPI0023A9BBC9|nr:YpbF family protein [Niallia taxi]MDE5052031.1 YpbF family protein [Niallia taxi]WOD64461.1 YpbF family protein [Niallia taxi]